MTGKDLNFQIKHIGVNCSDDESALGFANFFEQNFMIEKVVGKDSIYAGPIVEVMKGNGRGDSGHIAVGTDDIYKAQEFLESKGFEFDNESIKYDENGSMIVIYMKQEISGFAIHLLQNNN